MNYTILFTGHMIDKKEREKPRFPASKELKVRDAILKELIKQKAQATKITRGIAGAACGGDILFHELCDEIGINTEIYLAFPVEEFKRRSVSFAGSEWELRFDKLVKKLPVYILSDIMENNIWAATNSWMIDQAFQNQGENIKLIALWDLKGGDGTGGTEHMINICKNRGAEIDIININNI